MGGNESKDKKSKEEKVLTYEEKRRIYLYDHQTLQSAFFSTELFNDLNKFVEPLPYSKADLDHLKKNYAHQIKSAKLYNFENTIIQNVAESYVEKYLHTREFDVFKKAMQIYSDINFTEDESKKLQEVKYRFQKEFETKMSLIFYDIEDKIRNLLNEQLLGINANLKFNEKFSPNIFTLILNRTFLSKKQVAFDIAEMIENSTKLQIVLLIFYPTDQNNQLVENFGLDGASFQILYKLFNAIANNKYIKALFFHSVRDYKLIIPPEISGLIIKKLQSETLIVFHLGNITLSIDFVKKFFFQIVSTRSLLFLSIEGKKVFKLAFQYLFKALEKNNSLIALSLVDQNDKDLSNEQKIEEFKKALYNGVTPLYTIYLGNKSIFQFQLERKVEKNYY